MLWQHYYRPASVEEALALLTAGQGGSRLVAGATDVTIRLRRSELQVNDLVDINCIPGLDQIKQVDQSIEIGALVTHGQANASPLLRSTAPVLAEACGLCGSPQIRNVGTVVGNIINAQPAADGLTALLALDARLTVVSPAGSRQVAVSEACVGPGQSAIDSTREVVTAVTFKTPGPDVGTAYERLSQRRSLTLPVMACAVVIRMDEERCRFADVRIAVGPVAPVPFRACASEEYLIGRQPRTEAVTEAGWMAAQDARPRSGLRGGAEYRREMVRVLVQRALRRALERVGIDV